MMAVGVVDTTRRRGTGVGVLGGGADHRAGEEQDGLFFCQPGGG